MKILIPIVIGLLVAGCASSSEEPEKASLIPANPLTPEEKKVVGVYELIELPSPFPASGGRIPIQGMAILAAGKVEAFLDGVRRQRGQSSNYSLTLRGQDTPSVRLNVGGGKWKMEEGNLVIEVDDVPGSERAVKSIQFYRIRPNGDLAHIAWGDNENPRRFFPEKYSRIFRKVTDPKLVERIAPNQPSEEEIRIQVEARDREVFNVQIRKLIKKPIGDLTKEDFEGIKSLGFLGRKNITYITALSGLKNLEVANLENNKISDLSPLSALSKMNVLSFGKNYKIRDITPLGKLSNLQQLNLSFNQIRDIDALSDLDKMAFLCLDHNRISDLSPLRRMTRLRSLTLHQNDISNVAPLAGLKALWHLNLYGNNISDLSPLGEMEELKTLTLTENKISDLKPLAALSNLVELQLSNNQVTDLTPLSNLPNLKLIAINDNPVLTKTQIAKLQKALPKCKITHNAK